MPLATFSIGLTGGIGSGKTTVANFFAELGAQIIDTDLIAHSLTAADGLALPTIIDAFGPDVIAANGAMDRQKIRSLVFSQPEAKRKLENILHPMIRSECELQALQNLGTYPIFVVPLLVESGDWARRISRTLVIDCTEETQIKRVIARNAYSRVQVERIMQAQANRQDRLIQADDVIDSDRSLAQIRLEVNELHQKYLKLAHRT